MLEAHNISVALGTKKLLGNVSVNLRPGKINVILGPNGAGKSTLLGCLAGLILPSSGGVTLDNMPLADMDYRARARHIGFLPQNPPVYWDLAVRDLVALGRFPHAGRCSKACDDAIIDAAMAAADVTDFAARRVMSLSGGERARVLMARTLAGQPRWLLADEPLAGLDPRHQLQSLAQMRSMAQSSTGIVMVLHDLTLAAHIADHILLLKAGQIFAAGVPGDILTAENIEAVYDVSAVILKRGDRLVIVPQMSD